MPIGFRLAISVIPLLILSTVLTGVPVHWGSNGPIVPRGFGILFTACVCIPALMAIWYGVTLPDLRQFYVDIRNPSNRQTLFDKDKPLD
jgi:hypothetical protein